MMAWQDPPTHMEFFVEAEALGRATAAVSECPPLGYVANAAGLAEARTVLLQRAERAGYEPARLAAVVDHTASRAAGDAQKARDLVAATPAEGRTERIQAADLYFDRLCGEAVGRYPGTLELGLDEN